jgi:hypothetical protein
VHYAQTQKSPSIGAAFPGKCHDGDRLTQITSIDGTATFKAIPINGLTGGPQPPILGALESLTPRIGGRGPSVDLL